MEWSCTTATSTATASPTAGGEKYEGSLELKKDENFVFEEILFVRSFLDGRQRTVLFSDSPAVIDRTVNVAELEKMDLEVTANLKGRTG